MPRPNSNNGYSEPQSTAVALLRLSMTIDQLNPPERAIVVSSLDTLATLATLLHSRQPDPDKLPVKRRAKSVRAPKPVVKRRRRRVGAPPDYDPNRLVALRLNEKISQGELAKRLKVHFSTVSQAEKGNASHPLIAKLSKYFNTQLVQGVEPEMSMTVPPAARLVKHTNGSDE